MYLTMKQAAETANVSESTIRRYISSGAIPGYRMGARLLRVDAEELQRFIRRIPTAGVR